MDYRNGEAQERATGGLCEALANYVSAFRAHDRGAKPVEGARDDGGSAPLELERLNMFPDDYTAGASDGRRAFLMGNALVTGVVERIGVELARRIETGGKKVSGKR